MRVPYFLQIACERNSNVYRLVHEIVHICDVNTGVFEKCNADLSYSDCDYCHITIFPSGSDNDLTKLLYHRDIPLIVDGYESENLYKTLLREVANIPRRNKKLDAKDRLNVLPIFVSPNIKSTFINVFSIDFTDLDIDDDYLELIEENKLLLASWAYELVTEVNKISNETNREPESERTLFDHINWYTNNLRVRYQNTTNLTVSDIRNVGFISYYFKRFLAVINTAWRMFAEKEFWYNDEFKEHDIGKIRTQIVSNATDLLVELHSNCSPEAQCKVIINAVGLSSIESKAFKKRGEKYAKDIIKYYQSYGVSINILSDAEYKDERYVFSVKLLPGTNKKDISRYADAVRRLLDLEFFSPDISGKSIKLIASQKPLKENSLINMLESPTFKGSKMEIPYAVGYDIMGEMVFADIVEFPHLLRQHRATPTTKFP